MDAWQHWVKRFFTPDQSSESATPRPQRKTHQILLLVGLGVLLLLLSRLDPSTPEQEIQNAGVGLPTVSKGEGGYERELEERIERLLRAMRGVGAVEVMITLESSQTHVYAMERTEERSYAQETEAGARATTEERLTERPVVIRQDQGRTESPLIVTTYHPEVRGVVVLADGAYDPALRYEIAKVVQTALGVAAHRVQVYAKE